jgi:hypothetical protein
LRYDVGRHHLGVIAWLDHVPKTGDAPSLLNESISHVARSLAAESSITQPTGSLVVAAWFSSHRAFPTDGMAIFENGSRPHSLPNGLSIAVGEPGHGLAGFRRSHVQAGHARRVSRWSHPTAGQLLGTKTSP